MEIVATVASVPAVIAIVNVLKEFGVTGKWATLAAVLVGVALAVTVHLFGNDATFQSAMQGLLIGLGAAGLYDLAK